MIEELDAIDRVSQYIGEQSNLDTLRFITCGSVDDGKSTLIGRMLYEAQMVFDDQVKSLQDTSKKMGTQNGEIDFALLVDGLEAEREQGITIDVAYRYFSTDQRKFIVADTPGHEQYTRNMATGASTAELAVILIDARHGVLAQTRRHSIICSTLGIRKVVIAVNKMDLVNYDEVVFEQIADDYKTFAKSLQFEQIETIPISALKGENITKLSSQMSWYHGPTLFGFLEIVQPNTTKFEASLRFPVQWVNRPNADFRGFSGTIESGVAYVGQEVLVLPSGQSSIVKEIVDFEDHLETAGQHKAITLTLESEIDVSRGDVIVARDKPCEVSDQFSIKLFWMDKEPGYVGRSFWLKLGTSLVPAQITSIKHKQNINSLEHISATKLEFNDLYCVNIKTDRPIAFEKYLDCAALGSFILIDRMSNHTVAAGMIEFGLHRAVNIHRQKLAIDKISRRRLNGHSSYVIWFTGLSGAGKSTIANALETALHELGIRTYLLDGDNVRHGLNSDLGFTEADRVENIRRVGEVAKLMVDAGVVVLAATISPFQNERDMVRGLFEKEEFLEIFVDAPLAVTESRDPKGLYKKARLGQIPNFTGIDSPYERPNKPELRIKTVEQSVEQSVKQILKLIELD